MLDLYDEIVRLVELSQILSYSYILCLLTLVVMKLLSMLVILARADNQIIYESGRISKVRHMMILITLR